MINFKRDLSWASLDIGEKNNLFNIDHTKTKEMQKIFWKIHNEVEAERPRGGPGQGWKPIKNA